MSGVLPAKLVVEYPAAAKVWLNGVEVQAAPISDLVFDVRFLKNPHYEPDLRPQTGLDAPVGAHRPGRRDARADEAQEIAAKHAIRPRSEKVLKKYEATFKPLKQFTVAKYFGSLTEAQKVHFNDGGQFDKLYTPGK